MREILAAAAFVLATAAVAVGAETTGSPAPSVVERIVHRFVSDSSGVTVSRETVVYDQRAPGNNEHDEQDLSLLQQDRKVLGIRIHRSVDKGRVLSADELAKQQAETDKAVTAAASRPPSGAALPYYPEATAEYAFTAAKPCAECGGDAIDFKSAVNDSRHGHGTLTFDPVSARVVKVELVPNVAPKPATSAKLVVSYGQRDDGGWGPLRFEQHYAGRVLMISGTADRVTTVVRARRFATVDEARRAMQADSI